MKGIYVITASTVSTRTYASVGLHCTYKTYCKYEEKTHESVADAADRAHCMTQHLPVTVSVVYVHCCLQLFVLLSIVTVV